MSSLLFVVSAAAAVGHLAWSDRIERFDGCGFDGVYYCAMVRGEVVPEPFSRRILLPFLVRHVSADGLAGFWVVNVLSLVGATVIAMYVASRLRASEAAASSRAHQLVPILLVGAVLLSARNTFHLVATYPALSDPLGVLLLLGAVALVVTTRLPSTRLLLIPVCFLAPLAREELAPVLALGLVLAAFMRVLPRTVGLAASGASLAGGAFAFSQPNAGAGRCLTADNTIVDCPGSIAGTLRFWLDWDFGSWDGFFRFSVMLILAFGPFVFLLAALRVREWDRRTQWVVCLAATFTAVTIFGGGDTDRVLTPAGLLLSLAVVTSASRSDTALLALTLAAAAYAVQQQPLRLVSGEPTAWLEFYGLRITEIASVVDNALVPSLLALPLAIVAFWLLRSKPSPDRAVTYSAP